MPKKIELKFNNVGEGLTKTIEEWNVLYPQTLKYRGLICIDEPAYIPPVYSGVIVTRTVGDVMYYACQLIKNNLDEFGKHIAENQGADIFLDMYKWEFAGFEVDKHITFDIILYNGK